MIVNYNGKTFIVQVTGDRHLSEAKLKMPRLTSFWFYGIFKKCGLTCKIGSKNVNSSFFKFPLIIEEETEFYMGPML